MVISTFRILVVGDDGKWFSLQPSEFEGDERRIKSVGVFTLRGGTKGEKLDHEATAEEKAAILEALSELLGSAK